MLERRIRLNAVDDVREFVSAADKCKFDVDVMNNEESMIDGKSIIGVMSLDLTKELIVKYRDTNSRFEEVLDKFACA